MGFEEFNADGALIEALGDERIHLIQTLHRQLLQRLFGRSSQFALKGEERGMKMQVSNATEFLSAFCLFWSSWSQQQQVRTIAQKWV